MVKNIVLEHCHDTLINKSKMKNKKNCIYYFSPNQLIDNLIAYLLLHLNLDLKTWIRQ
jgi:hypothetical protein